MSAASGDGGQGAASHRIAAHARTTRRSVGAQAARMCGRNRAPALLRPLGRGFVRLCSQPGMHRNGRRLAACGVVGAPSGWALDSLCSREHHFGLKGLGLLVSQPPPEEPPSHPFFTFGPASCNSVLAADQGIPILTTARGQVALRLICLVQGITALCWRRLGPHPGRAALSVAVCAGPRRL